MERVPDNKSNPEVEAAPHKHPVGVDIKNLRKVFKVSPCLGPLSSRDT